MGALLKINNKLNINFLFFLFLNLLVITSLDLYVRCLSFFIFDNIVNGRICFLIAVLIFLILLFLVLKYKVINLCRPRFDKLDIFFIGIFLFYYLMKLPFSDISYDALSHEIFIGRFIFTSKMLNMLPNLHIHSGMFALAQRTYYYFTWLLGYRLTSIINIYIIITSYYILKDVIVVLFNYINKTILNNINRYLISIIVCTVAFISLYNEYIVFNLENIKGDIFVIPLFLECLLIILKTKDVNITQKVYMYSGLLVGLSVALKLTNVTFFIPFIIYFVIIERKNINIRKIMMAIVFCLISILPYIVYNAILTGNPVFPYYNTIFKSPYWPIINFRETSLSPSSLLEIIFWPFVILFNPGRNSQLGVNSHSLVIGYLVVLCVFFLQSKITELKKIRPMSICLLSSILLWALTTGDVRYALALYVFSFIILFGFIYTMYCNFSGCSIYLIFISSIVAIVSVSLCTFYIISHPGWVWSPSLFLQKRNYFNYAKPNIKLILKDRKPTNNDVLIDKLSSVKYWFCYRFSGYAVLANPQADFFWIGGYVPDNFIKNYYISHEKTNIHSLYHDLTEDYFKGFSDFGLVVTDVERFNLNFADALQPVWFFTLMTKEQADAEEIVVLDYNDMNLFSESNEIKYFGFYEKESFGTWINGNAHITVNDKNATHFSLDFDHSELAQASRITVIINNKESAFIDMIPGNKYKIDLDFENNSGIIFISIKTDKIFIPRNIGLNEDTRKLGVAVNSWLLQ